MKKCMYAWQMAPIRAICLVLFIAGLSACAPFQTHPQACPCGPGPQFFKTQPAQFFVTGVPGTFGVELLDITPQQFRFYYVFQATQPTSLQVLASTEVATHPSVPLQLATTNQTLGQIGSYTVGVVHVARQQNVAQMITLAIKPLTISGGGTGATWDLSPLKQLLPTPPHLSVNDANTHLSILPDAQWSAQVMSQLVSYVRIIMPGAPPSRSYLFLRSDDPVIVTVITKAEYLAIAGSANFTP